MLQDVIAHHHDVVTHQSPRIRWLAQAACAAASISGFHTVNSEQTLTPELLDRMVPPAGPGISLQFEDLLHTVAQKVNETECGLLY